MQRIDEMMKRRNRQTGGLTVFTAIMVLIILTLMIFYAARVGLFEQRVSANEVRQKTAFHAAEAALDQGIEYLIANVGLIPSNASDAFPDGAGGMTRDGWLVDRWSACTLANTEDSEHPCGGETLTTRAKVDSYFYDDSTTAGADSLPIGETGFPEGVTARISANLCFVDLSTPDVCAPFDVGLAASETYMIVTLLAYGYSDCSDINDPSTCHGEAKVAKPLANYKALAGSPTVPLVTKSTFPPTGTAFIVPNPNGGGIGVPISAWLNNNPVEADPPDPYCPQLVADVISSGTWNTCEMQEWYGVNDIPEGTACDQPNCTCTAAESISYRAGGTETVLGIDIVTDTNFPCDLFDFFFHTFREDYEDVKFSAGVTVLPDCSSLDESSSGMYWISGSTCRLNNTTLGSPESPVVLISAAESTQLSGSVTIFGVVYIFDGEEPAADISGNGGATLYGALIVDATLNKFTGSLDVVYSADVLEAASGLNALGAINGGWRDFGLPDVAW